MTSACTVTNPCNALRRSELEPQLVLELMSAVLSFESFPEKSHTGVNLAKWIKESLHSNGLEQVGRVPRAAPTAPRADRSDRPLRRP